MGKYSLVFLVTFVFFLASCSESNADVEESITKPEGDATNAESVTEEKESEVKAVMAGVTFTVEETVEDDVSKEYEQNIMETVGTLIQEDAEVFYRLSNPLAIESFINSVEEMSGKPVPEEEVKDIYFASYMSVNEALHENLKGGGDLLEIIVQDVRPGQIDFKNIESVPVKTQVFYMKFIFENKKEIFISMSFHSIEKNVMGVFVVDDE